MAPILTVQIPCKAAIGWSFTFNSSEREGLIRGTLMAIVVDVAMAKNAQG